MSDQKNNHFADKGLGTDFSGSASKRQPTVSGSIATTKKVACYGEKPTVAQIRAAEFANRKLEGKLPFPAESVREIAKSAQRAPALRDYSNGNPLKRHLELKKGRTPN
tara:strand:+ start:123 stop:446 length:324 start_codon:yes stop_codon:yes gene_type:complete